MEIAKKIVELLGGHPLAIELIAKTYKTDRNLTLSSLLTNLESKGLYLDTESNIQTLYDKVEISTYIGQCLDAAFSLAKLTKEEIDILEYFCLFPPEKTPYFIITKFIEHQDVTKGKLNYALTVLVHKGWLKEIKEGTTTENRAWKNYIFCHPVLQDSLINNIPQNRQKFNNLLETLTDSYLNYRKSFENFSIALALESFPIHIYKKLNFQAHNLKFSVFLSRYCHYQIYLGNQNLANQFGKIAFNLGQAVEGLTDDNLINLAKVNINLSYVYRPTAPEFAMKILFQAINKNLGLCTASARNEYFYFVSLRAFYELSSIYISSQDYVEAMEIIHKALEFEKYNYDTLRDDIFSIYRNKLIIHYRLNQKDDVQETIEIVKRLIDSGNVRLDSFERNQIYIQDASIYLSYGDLNKSIEYLEMVMSGLDSEEYNFIAYLDLTQQISRLYFAFGFIEQAIDICSEGLEKYLLYKSGGEKLINSFFNLAEYYLFKNNLEKVEHYFENARSLISQHWEGLSITKKINFNLYEAELKRYLGELDLAPSKNFGMHFPIRPTS